MALFKLEAEARQHEAALGIADKMMGRTFIEALDAARKNLSPTRAQAVARGESMRDTVKYIEASRVVSPRPVDHILDASRGRHVRAWVDAGETMWLIQIDDGEVTTRLLSTSPGQIRETAEALLASLDDPDLADRLGLGLFPHGTLPPPGETLYVIPSGILTQVPFAALRRNGRLVLSDHAFAQVPSPSALAALEATACGPHAKGAPLVIGDALQDRPFAQLALEFAGAQLGTPIWTGPQATVQRLTEAAVSSVIHLSTHARLELEGPRLALADGHIGVRDILSMRLRPRLVVLATCLSAAGRGRGLWGSLATAFLAAGARNTVGTLWSVDEEIAYQMVVRFYVEGGHRDPIGALARAQRAMALQSPPSAWANFVVLGLEPSACNP